MEDHVKYSKTSHDARSSGTGISAKTVKVSTKDERTQKIWKQAQQELNASQQNETVKTFWTNIAQTYSVANVNDERGWLMYDVTEIPGGPKVAGTLNNPDYRLGNKIHVKAIDATTNMSYTYEGMTDVTRAMLRIIWVVDKQPHSAPVPANVLAGVITGPENSNFTLQANLDYKDRFVILSDEIHSAENACATSQKMLFNQHIDVDMFTTWKNVNNNTMSGENTIEENRDDPLTANNIWVMFCPILTATGMTGQLAAMTISARITFTDA